MSLYPAAAATGFLVNAPALRRAALAVIAAIGMTFTASAAAGEAKGTIVYKARTVPIKYAYLVTGPDSVTKQPIRRVILSATDLGASIAACKKMMCTDGNLNEGISVNLDGSPRLNYWVTLNDQKIQYSGTEPVAALVAKVNDTKRVAGTLRFDKTAAGGPMVEVEFDAALVKDVPAP